MAPEFQPFPKIGRLFRDMVVTEKIDGTNACVLVNADLDVYAQSRKRLITPADDNYGFAAWVAEHSGELRQLGPGHHFGEWWGRGIQRGYGLDERRFSLFNTARWEDERPACCHVVPVLERHTFNEASIYLALQRLRQQGSAAAPGFMQPEGVVVYHTANGTLFKALLENDDVPKGLAA